MMGLDKFVTLVAVDLFKIESATLANIPVDSFCLALDRVASWLTWEYGHKTSLKKHLTEG